MLRITLVIISFISLFIGCGNDVYKQSNLVYRNPDTLKPQKTKRFYFEAKDKSLSERNFYVKREILNDSVFVEYGLICSSDSDEVCSLKFSYNNNRWCIWDGVSWHLFYDNKNNQVNIIELKYTNRTIKPEKSISIGINSFPAFSCRENDVAFTTDDNRFGFSPIYGIVILQNVMTYYKRSDFVLN